MRRRKRTRGTAIVTFGKGRAFKTIEAADGPHSGYSFARLPGPHEKRFAGRHDVRFALFHGGAKRDQALATAFFVDLDAIEMDNPATVAALKATVRQWLADRSVFQTPPGQWYLLDSGGGAHIYIPVSAPFSVHKTLDDFRDGSLHGVNVLESALAAAGVKCVVENKSLCAQGLYGRVPGSVNSKTGRTVTLLDSGPPEARPLPTHRHCWTAAERPTANAPTTFRRKDDHFRPLEAAATRKGLLENCAFMANARQNSRTLGGDEWFAAVSVAVARRDDELAHEITANHPEPDTKRLDQLISDRDREGTSYPYSCATLANGAGKDHCAGCPHLRAERNTPVHVNGRHPTPAAAQGFHALASKREPSPEDGKMRWTPHLDRTRLEPKDLCGHLLNLLHDQLYWDDMAEQLYGFQPLTGVYAPLLRPKGRHHQWTAPGHDLIERYIAFAWDLAPVAWTGLAAALRAKGSKFRPFIPAEFNPEHLVPFSNGVYDYNTKTFRQILPSDKLLHTLDTPYDEAADTSRINTQLAALCGDAEQLALFRAFIGLAVSNIPNQRHQTFLWISGPPSTGKSTALAALSAAVHSARGHGTDCAALADVSELKQTRSGGGTTRDFSTTRFVFVDDQELPHDRRETFQNHVSSSIKAFVGGAIQTTRPMRENPKQYIPACPLFVASNHAPPPPRDEGDGYSRRLRWVQFTADVLAKGRVLQEFVEDMSRRDDPDIKGVLVRLGIECYLEIMERHARTGSLLPPLTAHERELAAPDTGDDDSEVPSAGFTANAFLDKHFALTGNDHDRVPVRTVRSLVARHRRDGHTVGHSPGAFRKQAIALLLKRLNTKYNTPSGRALRPSAYHGKTTRCLHGVRLIPGGPDGHLQNGGTVPGDLIPFTSGEGAQGGGGDDPGLAGHGGGHEDGSGLVH